MVFTSSLYHQGKSWDTYSIVLRFQNRLLSGVKIVEKSLSESFFGRKKVRNEMMEYCFIVSFVKMDCQAKVRRAGALRRTRFSFPPLSAASL